MITMTQIAKLTGVSQPTVSRVLNGSRKVDPRIREKVLACAREHDYQPNVLAKGLQGRKTMLLGVLMPDLSNGFFSELTQQIELEARKEGYSVLLFSSGQGPRSELEFVDLVRRYRLDGALAVPTWETSAQWPEYTKKLDTPVVALVRRVQGLDSVYVDHLHAGAMAAQHLSQRGYRRFLFIGRDCDQKYLGFRQALESEGFEAPSSGAVCTGGGELCKTLQNWFRGGWGRAAVFAESDACALRVVDALRTLGLSVPGNVGVIGFDDSPVGCYFNPRLSSVSLPIQHMAQKAVARLLERVRQPDEGEPLDLPLKASLVIREST